MSNQYTMSCHTMVSIP